MGICVIIVYFNVNNDVWVCYYSISGNMVYGSVYVVFIGYFVYVD